MSEERRVISSLQHPQVKHLVKLRLDSAYRYEQGALLLDALKPIQEVATPEIRIYYTADFTSAAHAIAAKERVEVTAAVINKISGMESPEGIVAEIPLPPFRPLEASQRVLALDGISDPGNLGTLMRTALAFGWKTVYFLPGCCDPFNEKALRAARGAHFKLELAKGSSGLLQEWVQKENVQSLAAELNGISPENVPLASKRLLVLGNEAHGPSQNVEAFCTLVSIPMPGNMESLNVAVAGGILLYLLNNSLYAPRKVS